MFRQNDSEFPETSYSLIADLAAGNNGRFDEFISRYEVPLTAYLRSRGISWLDSEEAVAEFVARILENRKVFECRNRAVPFHRRLRTSLLHHVLDSIRRKNIERKHLERLTESERNREKAALEDPLEFGWAYSVLDLTVETFRTIKLTNATQPKPGATVPPEEMTEGQLDWEIFLRRYIGCPDNDLAPVTFTLEQICDRLKLPLKGMKDRCARIRRDFQRCLQEVLQDTISIGDTAEYLRDVRFSLMLGNSQCIDLGRLLPEFVKEPPMESALEFSMVSLSHMDAASLEELILDPNSELEESDLKVLWERMMNSRVYSGETISGASGSLQFESNIHDLLFGNHIEEANVLKIKNIAKKRGYQSCSVLQKLHHALYVLTIVVAKNRLGKTVTSFPLEQIVETIQRAMRYDDWLNERAKRELELGLRVFLDERDSGRMLDHD